MVLIITVMVHCIYQHSLFLFRVCVKVYALVVNTGTDTKIAMSIHEAPQKASSMTGPSLTFTSDCITRLDSPFYSKSSGHVNNFILRLVGWLLVCCFFSATYQVLYNYDGDQCNAWYLDQDLCDKTTPQRTQEWFRLIFSYFLLMYQFIPVSLYVSMTMVKGAQKFFMEQVPTVLFIIKCNWFVVVTCDVCIIIYHPAGSPNVSRRY